MLSSYQKMALVAAALAPSASALIQMQVRYSDNMIDVGNLNAFAATWETAYATSGSLEGIVTDDTYQTDLNTCQTDDKSDLTVQVTMDGAWGIAGEATAANMRDAIIQTAWNAVVAIFDENKYTIYSECSGTTWSSSPAYTADAACGPSSAVSCEDACADTALTPALTQCMTSSAASRLPSTLRVTAYDDGSLLADDLTITFAAERNPVAGGCGLVGVLTSQLASFVPVVGGLFAAGIDMKCE